jgi:enoyl-CoA hydratase/carnithine racemase
VTDLVLVEREGPVARLMLNRPEQRNAVSTGMIEQLTVAFRDLSADPEIRVVILAGAGSDFCAGADVEELAAAREGADGLDYGSSFEAALRAIEESTVPVIARVQGAALGAGCQLTVACDLAVASEDARLGIPSSRLGILITFENVQRLVLALGAKRAGEMLFTGWAWSGSEAAAYGLVNRATPASELDAEVDRVAGVIAEAAPLSVRGSKTGIAVVRGKLSVERSREADRVAVFDRMAAAALASRDLAEGIAAFRQRRRPEFEGR